MGYFIRLGKREKVFAGILILVILGAAGYKVFSTQFLHGDKGALRKILDEIEEKKSRFPDIKSMEIENDRISEEYEDLIEQIRDFETRIPSINAVSRLLGEITQRADGLNMDVDSIRQQIDREAEGYLKLKLNMKFSGSYSNAVNYLNRLQGISEYLIVEEIEIAQTKERTPLVNVDLGISLLLIEKGIDLSIQEKKETSSALQIKTDPFMAKKLFGKKDKTKDLKLAGVTWSGKDATAIINDEVVRVGSQIGEWKVIRIGQDAVMLSDGADEYSITLNR